MSRSSQVRTVTGHEQYGCLRARLTDPAARQAGLALGRSAAASAPLKFGIRPAAPGNRATLAARIADHTSWRRAAFAASTSAAPPASRS
jgi:hypothetical protein